MIVENTSFPDGSVWVRTHPVTHLADYHTPSTQHAWHQLTYATQGHLEVRTSTLRALVPPNRGLWIPAGTMHEEVMHAPVSVRTLYFAPGAVPNASQTCRTVLISPLLRELILHATRQGALDATNKKHAHVIAVVLDQLEELIDLPLSLRQPQDERAKRLARLIEDNVGRSIPLSKLAKRAGASLRTLERCFAQDTGMSAGDWRRRYRLLHAWRLLEEGTSVTRTANEVGYGSTSSFSHAFSQEFGMSPSSVT